MPTALSFFAEGPLGTIWLGGKAGSKKSLGRLTDRKVRTPTCNAPVVYEGTYP